MGNCFHVNNTTLTNERSELLQILAWRHQATRHYPSHCWVRQTSPHGVSKPPFRKVPNHNKKYSDVIMGAMDGVTNQQPHDCFLTRLFTLRSKKTSKVRATGLCAGNSPVTGEFPTQMSSYAENVSIWWRHRESQQSATVCIVPRMKCARNCAW